jgi:hypothetical protein
MFISYKLWRASKPFHLSIDFEAGMPWGKASFTVFRSISRISTQVEPIEDIESSTMDVRDFLFLVVEQLSFSD